LHIKKTFFIISFSILFQSCFSYKTVDYNNIVSEKKQKFEVKGVGGTNTKGRLVSKNDQTMILETNGQLQKISVSEIYEVRVKKFSLLKSSGLLVGTFVVIICVAAIGFFLFLLGA
jgi:hypothetical protein|tara:strand:+ start:1611 stop:1958 length:348 start_codon:yes stop_codon:yes gene_type:complete